jgi:predicted nucleotidyltransferase
MISDDSFKLIIDIITSQSGVRKIMLFGSYAREEMHADSDLDILVIVDDTIPDIRELKNMLYRTISAGIGKPCDILVEHEHTFKSRSKLPTIERIIAREGKILYAA